MSDTASNVNLNSLINGGNMGAISSFPDIQTIRCIVLVPKNTVIPQAQMTDPATFATYVNGKFQNNARGGRWFAFNQLDGFKDNTDAPAIWKPGRMSLKVYEFAPNYEVTVLQSFGNFIEMKNFDNFNGDVFYIDDNGNWLGTRDTTGGGGLQAYSLSQFAVPNHKRHTTKEGNIFNIIVQHSDPAQNNIAFKYYQANYSPDSIIMPQNLFWQDITSIVGTAMSIVTTTTACFAIKTGQFSADFVQNFIASLTSSCFAAVDLNTGGTLTIASISLPSSGIVVGGETYWPVGIVLSAGPGSSHKVQFSTVSISALTVILVSPNCYVTEIAAGNAGTHTF